MGKYVIRQTPRPMPDLQTVLNTTSGMTRAFSVAGSRALARRENVRPNFDVHGTFRISGDGQIPVAGQHVVVFIHGYNVTPTDALVSAREFFQLLTASLARASVNPSTCEFVLFTWPGDVGPVYFDDAQVYAQHSGVALYELLSSLNAAGTEPKSISLVSHSLGAHVALRCLSVLGERRCRNKQKYRVDRALLLAPAVEDDVFHRPERKEEYHFPESAFGVRYLHIGTSRSDDVLGGAFRVNEHDSALGSKGPESMEPLSSLSRRVPEVLGPGEKFQFEQHDFSPNSATIMNPALHVHSHGGYWANTSQTDYYVNLLHHEAQ